MTSLQLGVTPHRRAAARFVGKVRRALQRAVVDTPEITQTEIADKIGVNRSVINRQLRGTADLSLSRVAEIAQVLGYDVEFELVRGRADHTANSSSEHFSSVPATMIGEFKAGTTTHVGPRGLAAKAGSAREGSRVAKLELS